MELKRYLGVVLRRWWIVMLTTLAAAAVAVYLGSGSATVYESTATYLVRPVDTGEEGVVRATDALARSGEINSTYARIARSSTVKDRAKGLVADQGLSTSKLNATAQVLPGTNLIEISASGPDAEAAAAYAAAVGAETASFLRDTGEVYELQLLDPPDVGDGPLGDNRDLDLAVGVGFGLLAGAALAFTVEYLSEEEEDTSSGLVDPATDAYSGLYFARRIRQELSRCGVPSDLPTRLRRTSRPEFDAGGEASRRGRFTVATISLDIAHGSDDPRSRARIDSAVRDAAQVLMARARPHDVVARLSDERFGVLMPDAGAAIAHGLLEEACDQLQHLPSMLEVGAGRPLLLVCELDSLGLSGSDQSLVMARGL